MNGMEEDGNIDCDFFRGKRGPGVGIGCEITIHSIEIIEFLSEDDWPALPANIASEDLGLA